MNAMAAAITTAIEALWIAPNVGFPTPLCIVFSYATGRLRSKISPVEYRLVPLFLIGKA